MLLPFQCLHLAQINITMPKQRTVKDCTEIRMCVDDELNDRIAIYQAQQRIKKRKLTKPEAAAELVAMACKNLNQ